MLFMVGVSGFDRRPTQYVRDKPPVTVDTDDVWIGVAVAVVVITFLTYSMSLPKSWKCFGRKFILLLNLAFGALIVFAQYTYRWDTDEISTVTLYSPFNEEIHADIGLFIGLRGFNVTLEGTPEYQLGQKINFNERFRWDWKQGRFGFGSSAGKVSQEYRRALNSGVPLPITWVAEWFTLDGERIRYGRYYRLAGYYSHALLWMAFGLWLLSVLSASGSTEMGLLLWFCCGCTLVATAITYAMLRPDDLAIPFEDGVLRPSLGFSWYLTLVMGIISTAIPLGVAGTKLITGRTRGSVVVSAPARTKADPMSSNRLQAV